MGALTDNRKRCLVDLFIPLSSSASLAHIQSNCSPDAAQLKRQKVGNHLQSTEFGAPPSSSPPSSSAPSLPLLQQGPVQSCSRSFPSPCPLRRPVHGPQRIIRAFGRMASVGSGTRVPVGVADEGSAEVGTSSWSAKRPSLSESRGTGELSAAPGRDQRLDVESLEELKLEEYRRLVEKAQETTSADASFSQSLSSTVHDVTIFTEEENAPPHQATEGLQAENVCGRTTPAYKNLLLSARKRDSRLSSLEFEVKLAEKRISQFSIVPKRKPEKDFLGPFTPLTNEEEEEVSLALQDCETFRLPKNEVLVVHEGSNIEITRDVIQCLRHGVWLNDEVINLYFELLKEREKRDPKKFLKCHFFNTFFYKKLTGGRGNYDFKAVRRWTTKRKLGYDLIECDKIFVPIHKEIHWCLAVVDVKNEKLLYLDSLGGWDGHVLSALARYLVDEVKDKSNMIIDVTSWKQEKIVGLPLQKNGWDCGMFMLKYADFISRGLGLCFQQDNMAYFRKRTAKEILRLRAE